MKNSKLTTQILTRTAMLLALTLAFQALGLPTVITGPMVNFMLVLSVILVGTGGGVFIGTITPWIALLVGILPAPLAPAVPFIMAGNAILCLTVGVLSQSTAMRVLGVILGSLLKFAVIGGAASYVLTLPAPMAQMLTFPQLTNALLGGLLAVSMASAIQWAVSAGNHSAAK
ncbi:hypothetical protein [Dethiobacter alkaliphilus]|uniref:ECF transporter S component n=1 Tax=Dethiobacter alkaliphilus AHT 1 TaxID=555088 RepID=C0GGX8_DETAL|nr:hypothetical protein [Dethiobacter alkaliphilus]EEG77280.1 conserved hypothetical protein [Dethiobacter alkaliphilus AHT 1]